MRFYQVITTFKSCLYYSIYRMRKDILIAVFGLGIGILISAAGSVEAPLGLSDEIFAESVIHDIDTEEEWEEKEGFGGTEDSISFTGGQMKVDRDSYGESPFLESLNTHSVYRTELSDVSDDVSTLEELQFEAFVSENYESFVGIAVIDCSSSANPEDELSQRAHCGSQAVYNTDRIQDSGEIERTEDLSDIEVEGNIIIHMNLAIDEEEPVSEEQEPYIESVKLTGR